MALVELLEKTVQGPMGTLVDSDGLYLELGRRMLFPLVLQPYPNAATLADQAAFPPRVKVMQATIRDIRVDPSLQRHGEFTALVQYLLERDGAVHLEAVQERWLIDRLEASPLWIRQTPPEDKYWLPRYARVVRNNPFTLF